MILLRSFVFSLAIKTVFITCVILLLTTFNYFGQLLQDIIAGNLLIHSLLQLLLASSLIYLRIILPFAFFLAVLLELTSLYATNELITLFAHGMSKTRLMLLFSVPLSCVVLLTALLSLYLAPSAYDIKEHVWRTNAEKKTTGFIKSGTFTHLDRSSVIYVQEQNKTAETFHRVFLFHDPYVSAPGELDRFVMISNSMQDQNIDGVQYIRFTEGQSLYFDAYHRLVSRIGFDQYHLKTHLSPKESGKYSPLAAATKDLWRSDAYQDKAELQWRISLIVLAGVLVCFAVASINLQPRKSGWALLIRGLVFFFCYMLVLSMIQSYMWKGQWPVAIGMWPVHILALCYILLFTRKSA